VGSFSPKLIMILGNLILVADHDQLAQTMINIGRIMINIGRI
jgi:hypothetical protein